MVPSEWSKNRDSNKIEDNLLKVERKNKAIQPFLNCGYMNTCFKCGQKFLCKGHKDQFSTFETCIHITAFKTLL
jgi:hypothetical protein